jgi:hypothetical protein
MQNATPAERPEKVQRTLLCTVREGHSIHARQRIQGQLQVLLPTAVLGGGWTRPPKDGSSQQQHHKQPT